MCSTGPINSHKPIRTVGFSGGSAAKNPPPMQEIQETRFDPLVGKIPWKRGMATHPSILAGKNPKDRGAWWKRKWQPTPVFLLGKSQG